MGHRLLDPGGAGDRTVELGQRRLETATFGQFFVTFGCVVLLIGS